MSAAVPLPPATNRLLEPLSLAAFGTWGLIAFDQIGSLAASGDPRLWPVIASLLLFLGGFVAGQRCGSEAEQRVALALQLVAALANVALVESGSGPILGVVVAAQLPFLFPLPVAVAVMLASCAGYAAIFALSWQTSRPLFSAAMFTAFQSFALLVARLASAAERQRDELAQVNAHLLATRSLLEAGARDGERLRLSRELHDVAGHSLTALKLNLELALRVDGDERVAKIAAARDLTDALLEDIRAVVGQLRLHDGVDLAPALRALTERVPGPRVTLELAPQLRVARVAQAEAVLRCVQEALTNALRHSGAREVQVRVRHDGDALQLDIVDDGRGRAAVAAGHGLTGMRERIEDAGGRLDIETAPGRGFRLRARLPGAVPA